MSKRTLLILMICLLGMTLAVGQGANKTYVILAKGQGAGSTSFASALGASVIAQYDEIGIVVAQSSDPNFAAQAGALSGVGAVAEDPDRQWLPPNETAVLADIAVDDSAIPPPSGSSALPL